MALRMTFPERLLRRLNLLPTPLFDAMLAPGVAKAVQTAWELGLFDALSERPLSLPVLSERLTCEPEGLRLLVNVLLPAGYLRRRGGLYRNSRAAQRWLTSSSPASIAHTLLHSPDLEAFCESMAEAMRDNGQAAAERGALLEPMQELLTGHFAWLSSLAVALGNDVIRRAAAPAGSARPLDVGGPGAADRVLFCRRYPRLQAAFLDIQPGFEGGRSAMVAAGTAGRLSVASVDIAGDDFEFGMAGRYDVAVYFHIAPLPSPEIEVAVLTRLARTLKPGGALVFVDPLTNRVYRSGLAARVERLMTAARATWGGASPPLSTVERWLEQVGLGSVRGYPPIAPGATMITARKP